MAGFEKCFADRLRQAKRTGELPADFPAKIAADIIVTWVQGFFRGAQGLKNREQLWRQVETLLKSLGL